MAVMRVEMVVMMIVMVKTVVIISTTTAMTRWRQCEVCARHTLDVRGLIPSSQHYEAGMVRLIWFFFRRKRGSEMLSHTANNHRFKLGS